MDSESWWQAGFIASLMFLGAAFAYLGWVSVDDGDQGQPELVLASSPTASTSATQAADTRLRYSGTLPDAVDPSEFVSVALGDEVDIAFGIGVAGDEGALVVADFVVIVSPETGLYELSEEQVEAIFRGAVGNWSEVGGLDQPVTAVAGMLADLWLLELWFGARHPALAIVGSYEDAVALIAEDMGAVALVPFEFVDASVVAIAVEGRDPVRFLADLADWPYREFVTVNASTPLGMENIARVRSTLAPSHSQPATIVLTGDILQSRCTLDKIRATGDWAAALRTPVGEYLASADLAFGSLDGAIHDIAEPYGCVQITNLSSPPEVIEALTVAGIDGLTVATNHIFDCGVIFCGNQAFLRTLELLNGSGIKTWGGGRNLSEALQPGIFEVNGVRFGILGFDDVAAYAFEATEDEPGTAPLDDDYTEELAAGEPSFFRPAEELSLNRFQSTIESLAADVDVVLVQVQSGTEETHIPSVRSLKALPIAVTAGATVVIGNQAHWVQAVDYAPDNFVAYALGNFIFDQTRAPEFTEGVLAETIFHGDRLVNIRLRPYVIVDQYRPEFVAGERELKILGDIYEASGGLPPR